MAQNACSRETWLALIRVSVEALVTRAAASMKIVRNGPRRDARPEAETDAEALKGDSVKTSLDSE